MKILVLGLDCAAPELLFGFEDLPNIRRLMEVGAYGRLESVIPPITVPAWMCMTTSQDPGSLGVYGFRNRVDHSYEGLGIATSRSITEPAIWDHLAREGKRSIIIGVPPGYPPRRINGLSVGCFLTPDTDKNVFTSPPELSDEIRQLVGHYPVDVQGFRTGDKAWLRDEIFAMSRTQFQVVRHLLKTKEWDYFHFVDIGLDRVHHGFWKYHDPLHVLHEPDSPFRDTIHDYYRQVDHEIGQVLELLSDDTIVLVVSDHGAQRLDGGFCVNEWLVREGLLVLKSYPTEVTPFAKLDVDWEKTKVWSEGGYYARVFFNVKGREPQGVIEPAEYESFRDQIKAKFEATTDAQDKPMGTLVFKPEQIYHTVRNVAPDLIVHFGGLVLAIDRRRGLSDRSTSSKTTPVPTTATTPSSARSSWPPPTAPCTANSPAPTCWISRRRSWSWEATRSPPRCKAGRWYRARARHRPRKPAMPPTMKPSFATD